MLRRDFLKRTAASSLGVLAASSAVSRSMAAQRLDAIGLQLFTVDSLLREDFESTLKTIAATGYQLLEFSTGSGLHGHKASEIKRMLRALGLKVPNGRLRPKLPPDIMALPREQAMKLYMELASVDNILGNLELMLPEAATLGYENIILSAVPPTQLQGRDKLEELASVFNQAGKICSAQGMKFGYHNHDFDFTAVDGIVPFHFLIENTDPATVQFQLDTYWASKAGKNSADYPRRYPGRIGSCHMKDMAKDDSIVDVGAGTIDFPALTRSAIDNGVKYFFVEHDNAADPMASAVSSYNYLQGMSF